MGKSAWYHSLLKDLILVPEILQKFIMEILLSGYDHRFSRKNRFFIACLFTVICFNKAQYLRHYWRNVSLYAFLWNRFLSSCRQIMRDEFLSIHSKTRSSLCIKRKDGGKIRVRGLGLGWLCQFQQYFSYIVAVSFIGGENRSTWRKPLTCHKSLTNFIT